MKRKSLFIAAALCWISFGAPEAAAQSDDSIYLNAITDFPSIESGMAPYYKDPKHRALAINAANRDFRGKWAKAETTFNGENGFYDVTITALKELDGECAYRLLLNGEEFGVFTNPETYVNYETSSHTWPKIKISKGDKIAVCSKACSNEKTPERGGYAWARGRWRGLQLSPTE